MARRRRFYTQSSSFSAGLLSDAAQDNIDSAVWQAGLSKADNFLLLRDGGVRTRPPLEQIVDRDGLAALPVARWSALRRWSLGQQTSSAQDLESRELTGPARSGVFDAAYRQPLGLDLVLDPSQTTEHVLRLEMHQGSLVRAITFHDAVMTEGSSWSPELEFEIWIEPMGESARLLTTPTDVFDPTHFTPGRIERDVTVQLDHAVDGYRKTDGSFVQLAAVELRVKNPAPPNHPMLRFRMGAVSALVSNDQLAKPASAAPLDDEKLRQWRLLPWSVQGEPRLIAIGLQAVAVYDLQRRRRVLLSSDVWNFTERQLDRLSSLRYGQGLLLLHEDFPYGLEAGFSDTAGQEGFQIRPLVLRNLAQLPASIAAGASQRFTTGADGSLAIVTASGVRAPPRGLRIEDGYASLDVSWGAIPGAQSYDVLWTLKSVYDADPAGWRAARAESVTRANLPAEKAVVMAGSHTISGLAGETAYAVAVRSSYSTGNSVLSAVEFGTPLTGRPIQIADLEAAPGDAAGELDLTWAAPAMRTAVRYELQTRLAGSGEFALIPGDHLSRAYSFFGAPGADYQFRVRMYDRLGNAGDWSSVITATARLVSPPVPTGLTLTPGADADYQVVARWGASPSATGYEVEHRVVAVPENAYISSGDLPASPRSYPIVGEAGQTLQVRVQALRAGTAPSGFTDPVSRAVAPLPPAAPVQSEPLYARRNGDIVLAWGEVAGADSYEYETRIGVTAPVVLPIPGGSIVVASDGGLTYRFGAVDGVRYRVRIRAKRGTAESPWSNAFNIRAGYMPLDAPVIVLDADAGLETGGEPGGMRILWDRVPGAELYFVEHIRYLSGAWETNWRGFWTSVASAMNPMPNFRVKGQIPSAAFAGGAMQPFGTADKVGFYAAANTSRVRMTEGGAAFRVIALRETLAESTTLVPNRRDPSGNSNVVVIGGSGTP